MTAANPAPQVLLDDGHTHIEHHRHGGDGKPLLITFDPLLYLWPKPPFGLDFLRRQGVDVIAVRRKAENFYQPLSRKAFMDAVLPVARKHARVIAYGSSLGAYAALYYGRDLDCEIVAPSPRVSVHPVYGSPAWQDRVAFAHERFDATTSPRGRAIVLFDPREPTDRRFIECEVLPQFPDATVHRIPYAGHPCTQFLGDIGYLAPYMRALIGAQPLPALERRQRRRQSATYFQILADLCARRGRLPLARTLIDRSVALRENNLLAQRTLGLVATLQRQWPEAVVALERALQMDPADPLTRSMLDRARKGLQRATPTPGPASEPDAPQEGDSPTLWNRVQKWLRPGG